MPAKQVYGKRTAAKPSAAYAKFISPAKDVVNLTGEEVTERRGGRTARRPVRSLDLERGKEGDVVDLAADLDRLRIGEIEDARDEVKREKQMGICRTTRRRKTPGKPLPGETTKIGDISESTRTKEEDEPTALMEQSNVPHIGSHSTVPSKTFRGRKGRHQSIEQPTVKASPTKSVEGAITQEQTAKPRQRTNHQPAPATPTRARKLKAVVIPRSEPMSRLPTPDPIPDPDPYTSYVSPLLSLQSYGRNVISFTQWSAALEPYFTVTKIAEASFSEVYRLSAANTACTSMKESVLKLVPLRGPPDAPFRNNSHPRTARNPDAQAQKDKEVREEEDSWKSHVDDVHSEVKLLQNLNYIPGFTNFRELTVLQGRPSRAFVEAWKLWNKGRPRGKKSEFPDPSKKASYGDMQLWAVIEMQDAGTDIEKVMDKGGLSTIWEVWDVFWGVCLSVAKAEEACRFEHRDLHLENICIRSSRSESEDDLVNPMIKDPLRRKLGFTGLETTVIDYTLSRADVSSSVSRRSSSISNESNSSQSSPSTPSAAPEVAFLDLNKDMGLFTGDASEEYQYEIYRYMRGAVYYNDPLKSKPAKASGPDELRRSPRKTPQHIRFDEFESPPHVSPRKHLTSKYCDPPSDIWRDFHPKTNLVWAHFILYKLLEHLEGNEPANLSSKQIMRNVEASDDDKNKVVRKAMKLYKVLERAAELLEPSALAKKDSLGSMKELAVLAMEERWLRVDDVAGS